MIQNKSLKRRIIEISYDLSLGHIGSNLTAVDIIEEIYKLKKPDEKFVLSAGHAHLAHLVVKESKGMIDFKRGETVEGLIEKYGIHCDRQAGCDVSTGSLGHGWGIVTGMALAQPDKMVYLLSTDGELAEGSCYEALNVIKDRDIQNIRIYINANGYGAYRETTPANMFYDDPRIKIINTYDPVWPEYLQKQLAHYKVLDKSEYEELMELLK